jgi:hypothetical protein
MYSNNHIDDYCKHRLAKEAAPIVFRLMAVEKVVNPL